MTDIQDQNPFNVHSMWLVAQNNPHIKWEANRFIWRERLYILFAGCSMFAGIAIGWIIMGIFFRLVGMK